MREPKCRLFRCLATVARSAAVRPAPMLDMRPVSSAARIAFDDILRSVSGGGAPRRLPALLASRTARLKDRRLGVVCARHRARCARENQETAKDHGDRQGLGKFRALPSDVEPAQAPAGDGHGLDQIHLDGVGGVELLDVGVEEELELFVGFAGSTTDLAERPWRRLLRDDLARPCGVAGPRDLAPLARAASAFETSLRLLLRSDDMMVR